MSVAVDAIDLMATVTDVARRLDILAFDLAARDPDTSDALRELYQDLENASNLFAFGPLFGRSPCPEPCLTAVPDRPLDEDGQR